MAAKMTRTDFRVVIDIADGFGENGTHRTAETIQEQVRRHIDVSRHDVRIEWRSVKKCEFCGYDPEETPTEGPVCCTKAQNEWDAARPTTEGTAQQRGDVVAAVRAYDNEDAFREAAKRIYGGILGASQEFFAREKFIKLFVWHVRSLFQPVADALEGTAPAPPTPVPTRAQVARVLFEACYVNSDTWIRWDSPDVQQSGAGKDFLRMADAVRALLAAGAEGG